MAVVSRLMQGECNMPEEKVVGHCAQHDCPITASILEDDPSIARVQCSHNSPGLAALHILVFFRLPRCACTCIPCSLAADRQQPCREYLAIESYDVATNTALASCPHGCAPLSREIKPITSSSPPPHPSIPPEDARIQW